ncbi:MAG: tetratricopeptide repeat protein [Marinicella sp.]
MLLSIVAWANANGCKELYLQGKIDEAFELCTSMAQTSDEGSDDYLWTQLILFDIEFHKGDHEVALQMLLNLSKVDMSSGFRYELLRRQGHYFRVKKRFLQAKDYYQDALNIAEELNSDVKLAKSYNDLGLLYLKEKNYDESINFLIQSLKIKRQLNDPEYIRTTITNLGLLYFKTDEYDSAIEHYQEAEKILLDRNIEEDIISRLNLIHLYSYISSAYQKWGKTESAEKYLNLFLQHISEFKSDQESYNRLIILVELLIDNGNFETARTVLQKLSNDFDLSQNNQADYYYLHAVVAYEFDEIQSAKQYATQAWDELELHQTSNFKQELILLLSKIENKSGNYQQALNWYQQYHDIYSSDLNNKINQDFKIKKYEQALDNNRLNLVKSQLTNTKLEKRNYQILSVSLVALGLFLLLIVYLYYQKKIATKNNLLLNKDIEKHKALYELLENQPISFKNLFDNKPHPILVLDQKSELIYANFQLEEEEKKHLFTSLITPQSLALLNEEHLPEEKVSVPFNNKQLGTLKKYSQINVQKVLGSDFSIWSFCNPTTSIDLSTEINAINQFNYYLQQHHALDKQQTRKLIVDCMNTCINIWTKSTSSNRAEFADQSQVWKINIDDGRLRTRSLDRYLSISTVPKNPRILQVIKSCEFMLLHKKISTEDKQRIGFYLERLKQAV